MYILYKGIVILWYFLCPLLLHTSTVVLGNINSAWEHMWVVYAAYSIRMC